MIITLCGSARFEGHFHLWNKILTLSGHTVFSLAVFPSTEGVKDWYSKEEKEILDRAHLLKIKSSDAIFVLNPFAYIGPSTLNEIKFAKVQKKKRFALESWGKGCGVGEKHTKAFRLSKKSFEIDDDASSPIDTFFPHFKSPWDLLPEAGYFRSDLVKKIEAYNFKIGRGEA